MATMICQAQVFPESDAIWNIQIDGKEYYYGLSGDTIINDTDYNKLYLLNDTTLIIDSADEYLGGFRQEEKTVWFRPSFPPFYPLYDYTPYPEETVLYDFSKNTGDTIWHNVIPDLYYWTMKDSISASIITSIDMDEWGRKIYHTSQYLILQEEEFIPIGRYDRWAEGIGSINYGLFWFLSQITVGGFPQFHLACFKQGNEVKYMDNAKCNSCFCWSSAGISEKNRIPLAVVYENNSIRIKGEAPVFPCDFRLFSPTGQLILEQRLQSDEIIPFNQKGIWLYQVQKNEEVVRTGKIMIK